MKKLLGILVLYLVSCNIAFADAEKVLKEIKKNKDIARGFNKVKSVSYTHLTLPTILIV